MRSHPFSLSSNLLLFCSTIIKTNIGVPKTETLRGKKGNPLYSPLALVIIGGLISSTLLSRLVTPVMYKLLPPKVEVLGEKPGDIPLE
jgi:hypothetical protein